MNAKKLFPLYLILLFLALLIMFLLGRSIHQNSKKRDFSDIQEEGVLRVVTEYNSVDYYVSGDSILGLQYELCKSIEKYSGIAVEIYLENNMDACIQGLEECKFDVIARNIPVTNANKQLFAFTIPISKNKQVLIQRKADFNNGISPIRNQIDLAKKTLYIPQNSPSKLRIHNLSEEIADTIYVKEIQDYSSEQLLYMVAFEEIDYAVVDNEIAIKNKDNFPQIDFETDISFTQFQAWALRKTSPILLDSLNVWISKYKENQN